MKKISENPIENEYRKRRCHPPPKKFNFLTFKREGGMTTCTFFPPSRNFREGGDDKI
jgi:hypothetical protein